MTRKIKWAIKQRVRIMGMDIGSHTIGIAISDELGITAQGLKTIIRKSKEEDLKRFLRLLASLRLVKSWSVFPKI